jgi:signal transduction histidine kinase
MDRENMKRLFIYVYLYLLMMFLVVYFGITQIYPKLIEGSYEQAINVYWGEKISGYYYVIETEIERLPVEQWSQTVKTLQTHFAFPIDIKPLTAMRLSASETSALEKGEIVVRDLAMIFHHQIGQSGMVLTLGPLPPMAASIPGFSHKLFVIKAMFGVIVVLLFLVFALIWALPLGKGLKQIGAAAAAFGQGSFEVRAEVSKRSSLASLAEAFNSMANRIQKLIASHKELVHTVSHELRTPLARIRFDMEMMASAEDVSERELHHEAIRRNVDELEMLISELLAYSRFDHESVKFQKETLDLAPWLKDLVAAWNDENEKVHVDYRINIHDPKLSVQVNPRFLDRAVRNLLQNAARHTGERIHVTLETEENLCLIHVDDDGPGIAEADCQRIFEPFVRLEKAEELETDGHGLGLSIVRRVAELHGGHALVGEAPVGGARFTLSLPRL